MPIVVNSNSAATTASLQSVRRANDSLRKSLARLSSGKRIESHQQMTQVV